MLLLERSPTFSRGLLARGRRRHLANASRESASRCGLLDLRMRLLLLLAVIGVLHRTTLFGRRGRPLSLGRRLQDHRHDELQQCLAACPEDAARILPWAYRLPRCRSL